jgi:hypothetical protein
LRSNGAISGAASNFSVGDTVTIMMKVGWSGVSDNKVITGGQRGGGIWSIGYDFYGQLGLGESYIPTEKNNPAQYYYWGSAQTYFGLFAGRDYAFTNTDYGEDYYPSDSDDDWVVFHRTLLFNSNYLYRYDVDYEALPESFTSGPFVYSKSLGTYLYWYGTTVPAFVEHGYVWPTVETFTKITTPSTAVYAAMSGGNTFILDSNGNMYCCGDNSSGTLGIGAPTGWKILYDDGYHYPFTYQVNISEYYTATFIKVPGSWKQIVAVDTYYVWAIKSDGTLWVTGANGGGLEKNGTGTINTFTKYSDDVWECYFSGLWVKLNGDNYDLYILEEGGTFTFYFSYPISLMPALLGMSLEAYILQLDPSTGSGYYIGGSINDPDYGTEAAKPANTLWDKSTGLQIEGSWLFTTGTGSSDIAIKKA